MAKKLNDLTINKHFRELFKIYKAYAFIFQHIFSTHFIECATAAAHSDSSSSSSSESHLSASEQQQNRQQTATFHYCSSCVEVEHPSIIVSRSLILSAVLYTRTHTTVNTEKAETVLYNKIISVQIKVRRQSMCICPSTSTQLRGHKSKSPPQIVISTATSSVIVCRAYMCVCVSICVRNVRQYH